ncbi:MAG TPA: coenzyme F420-0:L-glutamate ligase [Aeromicrobium sp.]|nr:coenzyme F420-0:L-glutamate ligase [Aeromicrobium sp.]
MSFEVIAIDGVGEVEAGTDLADLVLKHVLLQDGDVVVITSKVVSKALGLATARPKPEVIADETDRVVASRGDTIIVRTRHGLTLAAAGVDASNIAPGAVLPLPPDPDGVARDIRAAIRERSDVQVAVVISDTAGRAWRIGQTDIAIGCAGLAPFDSFAGRDDGYGNPLVVTFPAVADEVASAAELATGKLGQRPIAIIRGLDPRQMLDDDGPGAAALIRDEDGDMFGLGARDAVLAALAGQPVRGFPDSNSDEIDLLRLADPGGLELEGEIGPTPTGFVIEVDTPDQLVVAGMIRQRLIALAVAHGMVVPTVDVMMAGVRIL